jgi:hypothetical protein
VCGVTGRVPVARYFALAKHRKSRCRIGGPPSGTGRRTSGEGIAVVLLPRAVALNRCAGRWFVLASLPSSLVPRLLLSRIRAGAWADLRGFPGEHAAVLAKVPA